MKQAFLTKKSRIFGFIQYKKWSVHEKIVKCSAFCRAEMTLTFMSGIMLHDCVRVRFYDRPLSTQQPSQLNFTRGFHSFVFNLCLNLWTLVN